MPIFRPLLCLKGEVNALATSSKNGLFGSLAACLDAVRDWSPELEIDPAGMLKPAYHCGIRVPEGIWAAHSPEPCFERYRSRTIRVYGTRRS